ncbi:carboxypeptidase-like regulatory domain-containing protein [Mucilaginibacter sp. HC2]|uniref:carboxypeptidase-like regulatory domain-containing protein n=1 Tax=Mucilaginibacter inviolabilis TaxID=2714892 RepID=UPI001408A6AD|nr:carboxypeptidase-like regulatory domain-containing protein [Mucilaginibacter inviolabilis]NHA07538.1 carboxypeptidase-like regulatory domain-containing protein [Mucilaginibacter inviolabilis]
MRGLLTLLLIYTCLNTFGQSINGIVVDKKTGQPLTGAWVSASKANTISGIQGEFSINADKAKDTLRVKMQGYKLYILPLNLVNSKNIRIDLEAAIIELNEVHVTAKRDRIKDSLNNRKMFAKEFNSSAPKLKDMIAASGSNAGLLPVAGVTIVPSEFIRALTYKHSREYKLKKELIRDEQNRYIDSRFSENLVSTITNLKGDSLLDFMDRYRPGIEQIKKMSDYDIRAYIKASKQKMMGDSLAKAK